MTRETQLQFGDVDSINYQYKKKQDVHQLVGQAKHRTIQIRPKAVGSGIFAVLFRTSINADRKPLVMSYPAGLRGRLILG